MHPLFVVPLLDLPALRESNHILERPMKRPQSLVRCSQMTRRILTLSIASYGSKGSQPPAVDAVLRITLNQAHALTNNAKQHLLSKDNPEIPLYVRYKGVSVIFLAGLSILQESRSHSTCAGKDITESSRAHVKLMTPVSHPGSNQAA